MIDFKDYNIKKIFINKQEKYYIKNRIPISKIIENNIKMENTEKNNKFFVNSEILSSDEFSLDDGFSEIFATIKKKLRIKKSRKTNVDCLLKKSKCKFLQTVQGILKFMTKNSEHKKLPQAFITNITYEYNRKYLDINIIKILEEFNLINTENNVPPKENLELYKEFSQHTFSSLYNEYLKSNKYKKDLNYVIGKNGKNIGILYEFVSKNFINYYTYNKHISQGTEESQTRTEINE